MPSPSLDFNNLPHEFLNLTLRRFKPRDRVKISLTCKHWYEVITKTQAFWRELLIKEDTMMEETKQMIK